MPRLDFRPQVSQLRPFQGVGFKSYLGVRKQEFGGLKLTEKVSKNRIYLVDNIKSLKKYFYTQYLKYRKIYL